MNPRIPDTHAEAWALLPWVANGRISPEEREWVEAHAHECPECRAELATQRQLAQQMGRDGAASPPSAASEEQRSFNKLWARIEAAEAASAPIIGTGSAVTPAPRAARTIRWLAAAVVVQAIGLGLLATTAFQSSTGSGANEFTTVSTVDSRARNQAPAVRIVFSPDASITAINTLLAHQGLSIVNGPGTSGNFTAELSANAVASGATAESVADVISRDPHVSFAQPVAR